MSTTIRVAAPEDADAILAIYVPIVRETAISFEVEPLPPLEMRARIATTLQQLPWLVCTRQEEVLGYVYASPHRARAAYQWSVDVSVYIHPKARRTGMGRALYHALFHLLILQGLYQCFAGIPLPNPASVGLHASLGFQPVGVYQAVGYKLGVWLLYPAIFLSPSSARVQWAWPLRRIWWGEACPLSYSRPAPLSLHTWRAIATCSSSRPDTPTWTRNPSAFSWRTGGRHRLPTSCPQPDR
jgi:L-amino acid N-acyltransferase YncA